MNARDIETFWSCFAFLKKTKRKPEESFFRLFENLSQPIIIHNSEGHLTVHCQKKPSFNFMPVD